MQLTILIAVLIVLTVLAFVYGRKRALVTVGGNRRALHSMPSYHGWFVALWCGLPAAILLVLWLVLRGTILDGFIEDALGPELAAAGPEMHGALLEDVRQLAAGNSIAREPSPALLAAADRYSSLQSSADAAVLVIGLVAAALGLGFAWRKVGPKLRARNNVEAVVRLVLFLCSVVAIVTTIGIVLSVLFEAIRFFGRVPFWEFLFGVQWSPQMAIREDQVGSSGAFGIIPLFTGTIYITLIALIIAMPIGLLSAIYMAEYASPKFRNAVKPILEILAGIPTVVYGFFAALTVGPAFRGFGDALGLSVSSESALAAGVVMGIMIIPFISSLTDDAIVAVPRSLREGAYALGATKSETVVNVIIPAALPGIVAAFLLAVSRAIGETMIVVMAAGLTANLTANPLDSMTTVTVQIVTLLVGDQEFDSPKTLAAFALGLVLFIATLVLNVVALHVSRKYRERYD
ncbi:MAG: phosphate ABC transporter permease subunit PstC [Alphaproteobacteria bacterium]|nr:phosphate ABC transporter permease subunit PstC [Alphaproteobacteria bacterium]